MSVADEREGCGDGPGGALLELLTQLHSQRGQQRALCVGQEKHYLLPLLHGCHSGCSGQWATTATSHRLLWRLLSLAPSRKRRDSRFVHYNLYVLIIVTLMALLTVQVRLFLIKDTGVCFSTQKSEVPEKYGC